MRVLILSYFLATTLAIPQGYNYQQQQQQSSFSFRPQISSGSSSSVSSNNVQEEGHNFLQQAIQSPKVTQTLLGGGQQQSFGIQSYAQPLQQSIIPQSFGIRPQIQPQQPQAAYQPQQYQQNFGRPPPVVTKDIYVHVAPEEPEESFQQQAVPLAPPRKHYRIVFIKAPTPKISSSAALRLQQVQSEEKTIIYVLTKKPDPLELESAIQEAAPKAPSKPEVYFIKYKTPEEAQHAQRTIQAQYDKLGGTTQVSDEGVAPVTSVIGSLDKPHSQISTGGTNFATSSGGGFNNVGVSTSYGTPLSTGSISSSNINSASKYLPPIRI